MENVKRQGMGEGSESASRQQKGELQGALDRALADSIPIVCGGLALLFAVLTYGHTVVISGYAKWVMVGLSGVTAVLLGWAWCRMRWGKSLEESRAHVAAALIVGLLAINSLIHVAITTELKHSTNIALLVVSVGCFFTSTRWFLGASALILGTWGIIAWQFPPGADVVHYYFMNLVAISLAGMAHRARVKLILNRERALLEQRRMAEELLTLSVTDALTGLSNRRQFDDVLESEWQRAIRNQRPVSLVFVDVDRFKAYNDFYGHLAGDDCLRRVAQGLQPLLGRTGDLLARYGGEEFVLLLPETDEQGAAVVAERLRRSVEALHIPHECTADPEPPFVSVSLGVATSVPLPGAPAADFVDRADGALYRAKENGRNRVECDATDATADAGCELAGAATV